MRVAIVLPRNMHFGPMRATAIDLCVRDFVRASAFRDSTLVLAEEVETFFDDAAVAPLAPGARPAAMAERIRAHRPDIVLVQQHRPTAAALARRLSVPVALHRHGLLKPLRFGPKRWLVTRDFARLAGIIAASHVVAESVRASIPSLGLPVAVVHNGLDACDWHPRAQRAQVIAFAGRLAPEKGVLEAAEALARVLAVRSGWRARLMLAEPLRHAAYAERVRAAIAPVADRIEWREDVPHAQVKEMFETAAIVLVPSVWAEPFGRTALEAMAGGAALVTSARGGLREVVGADEEGAVLALGEVSAATVAAALLGLTDDPQRRAALAARGRARAEAQFDIRAVAARFDDALSMIAGAARR